MKLYPTFKIILYVWADYVYLKYIWLNIDENFVIINFLIGTMCFAGSTWRYIWHSILVSLHQFIYKRENSLISENYVSIYVTMEQLLYGSLQWSYSSHSMIYSMYQLMISIYRREESIFLITLLLFALLLEIHGLWRFRMNLYLTLKVSFIVSVDRFYWYDKNMFLQLC